jgi:hypothetical protein
LNAQEFTGRRAAGPLHRRIEEASEDAGLDLAELTVFAERN